MKQQDFYASIGDQPFRRDLSDRKRFFDQRDSLLRHLGIVPRLLRGASILEFGPGFGENALFLLTQQPADLVLVEINAPCLAACRTLLEPHRPDNTTLSFHLASSDDFQSDRLFDLVIMEGVIPFEPDPAALLRQIARFVVPGGLVSITCIDPVSLFAEALRRLAALLIASPTLAVADRVTRLLPVFSPHLTTLSGMSRAHADWIMDQLIHPWTGNPFSIRDATLALRDDFDPYGSSPHFLQDWRWFRALSGDRDYGGLAESGYFANLHNFLDYRHAYPAREIDENRRLLALCEAVLNGIKRFEADANPAVLPDLRRHIAEIAEDALSFSSATGDALQDYLAEFDRLIAGQPPGYFGRFAPLFGRGQQYFTLIRREGGDGFAQFS